MGPINGKAIFNQKGTRGFSEPRSWRGDKGDDLVSIDYPTHALFTDPYGDLRQDSARPIFTEWMLGSSTWDNPDRWTEDVLKGVRSRLETNKLGIFSPAFARFQEGSGNGDGFSVTRWLGNKPYPKAFGDRSWHEGYKRLLRSLQAIPQKSGPYYSGDTDITTGAGDDVVMPGWLGNGTINTGAGNDIILSSPQVNAAVLYDTRFAGYGSNRFNANQYVYLPTAYAGKGTKQNPNPFNSKGNTYRTGAGNDLIYYDGGTDKAFGGEGNDIFAPSFGSFNWAIDTLVQDVGASFFTPKSSYDGNSAATLLTEAPAGLDSAYALYAPFTGRKSLVSPLSALDRKQELPTNATLGHDYGAYGYSLDYERTTKDPYTIEKSSFLPSLNSGLSGDPATIDNYVNILGGQKLYGGPGNDLFYGIDPGFYQGFETAGNGKGLRLAFNRGKNTTGREHAQIIEPIQMLGGLGSDYFSLGNPANLDPDRIVGGDYIYRISGNHDAFLNRSDKSFGSQASADVFDFNVTYQGENWERTIVTSPGSEGTTNTAQDYANAGFAAMSAVQGLADAFGKAMPVWGAIAGLGSFVTSLTGLFQPKPKDPITQTDKYFRDPLGSWSKKTNIQDWDPLDAIVIRVDPADSRSSREDRWEKANFSFKSTSDTSDKNALDINYEWGNEKPATIVRLENFNDKTSQGKGAWFAWNFNEEKRLQIDSSHLSFFGQIPLGQKAAPLNAYKDEYGFDVKAGESVFRWTDSELRNRDQLSQMRSLSESIVVQLDTRALGYFWEPRYQGKAIPSSTDKNPIIDDLKLDEQESKLWIKKKIQPDQPMKWISHTFEEISKNPAAQREALRATTVWDTELPAQSAQKSNENRVAIDTEDSITGLTKGMTLLKKEIKSGIDKLNFDPLTGEQLSFSTAGRLINKKEMLPLDLNDVRGVIAQSYGKARSDSAMVYYTAPENSKFALLKAIVDNNAAKAIYGLKQNQVLRDESRFGIDLNRDNFLG
jgi:hypothetical protein